MVDKLNGRGKMRSATGAVFVALKEPKQSRYIHQLSCSSHSKAFHSKSQQAV
jgi:hypothetical protein